MILHRCVTSHPAPKEEQRGSAFLEFVLVAPIILFIAGYSLRFAQQLQAQQIGLILSRELATSIFVQCADFTIQDFTSTSGGASGSTNCTVNLCVDVTQTTAAIKACLDKVLADFPTSVPILSQSATITAKAAVYRYNINTFNITTPSACATSGASSANVTTITPTTFSAPTSSPTTDSICKQNRMARAQVSFTVTLSRSFLPGLSSTPITITNETTL